MFNGMATGGIRGPVKSQAPIVRKKKRASGSVQHVIEGEPQHPVYKELKNPYARRSTMSANDFTNVMAQHYDDIRHNDRQKRLYGKASEAFFLKQAARQRIVPIAQVDEAEERRRASRRRMRGRSGTILTAGLGGQRDGL